MRRRLRTDGGDKRDGNVIFDGFKDIKMRRRTKEGSYPSVVIIIGILVTVGVVASAGAEGRGTGGSTPVVAPLSPRPTQSSSVGVVEGAESSRSLGHDVVTAARCRVRCLTMLKLNIDVPLLSNVKETTSMVNCLRDPDCTTCLKPCNQPLLSQDHCEDVCKFPKEDRICSESCKFLKEMKQTGSGVCPSHTDPNTTLSGCGGGVGGGGGGGSGGGGGRRSCVSDKNCDKDFKCCVTHCGTMLCRRAQLPLPDDLPEVPQTPSIREKPRGGSVELKWNSVSSNGTGPVLYIVDFRWNIGKRHSEANMTTWQQVAQTTATSAVINDITPGHWYQFRVSSVNIQGSRGGSLPTQAFTLSKEPRKPGPPTNLTEGDTLIAGGKMTITIRWFPPKKSDLPVTRYKLYWSKRLKPNAAQLPGNRELRKVLPGNSLTYQIQNLDSDTTYIVQVQAICQYGEARLKSEKASIYITTYPLPKPADQYGMPSDSAGASRVHPTPSPVVALSVDKPFYDNGILKANVSWRNRPEEGNDLNSRKFLIHWSPEACIADSSVNDDSLSRVMSSTTSENHFAIHDLRTDCRYLVKVESVSIQGITGKAELISFSTPACGQAQSIGKLLPDCLGNVPRIPEEPPDLVHRFLISNSNITSRLSWGTPASESPISGYRVTWGPVLHPHHSNPIMDKASTFTKVLSKDVRSMSIGNLLEGTTYVVRVQAYSKFGHGQIASIQFATPLLQVAPIDQPYREVHGVDNKKQDVIRRKGNTMTNSTHTTTNPRTDRKMLRPQTPTAASLASLTVDSFFVITTCLLVQSFVTFLVPLIPFKDAA